MSRRDFLPDADAPFRNWCRNFVTAVAADPGRFGLTPSDAAELEGARAAFDAAYATAGEPSTRTVVAVYNKNQARAALERLVRSAAQRVQSFPGTLSTDRIDLGLSPRLPRAPRINAPATRPLLRLDAGRRGGGPGLLILDDSAPYRLAFPRGVASALVFTCALPPGIEPPPDLDGWRFEGIATKARFPLPARHDDAGLRVYATAVWANPRGQLGPRATPLLLSPGITLAAA